MSVENEYEDAFNEFAGDQVSHEADEDEDHGEVQTETEEEVTGLGADESTDEGTGGDAGDDPAEKYRQEVEQWKHRYNSDIGRLNAYQRKIQELEQQVQAQSSKQPAQNPDGSGLSDAEWDSLKEDFPEIAQAIDAKLSGISQKYEQQIAHLQGQMAPIQQQAHEHFKQAQYQILEQQHPDWQDVAASTDFRQWLNLQPQPVQQLISSESAADAAYLIQSYKAVHGQQQNHASDEIRQRRQQQLRQAQTIPGRGKRRTTEIPDDFEAAFNYYADQG